MKQLELLAPAKNLEVGMAAISHGADAVYIGAAHHGARAAAGNSLDDIAELCRYAHQFGAKVYVTVNTIVYEDELEETEQLVHDLERIGVDAMLVQDMGTLSMPHTMTLHASTQCDSRTPEKVAWLRSVGFRRVVLARELSLDEIREIHRQVPDVELEVFVHGALCVSYSGICYASQECFGRSANRGECAQFCRMKFDLVDADGREIEHQRHLLSLKDMSRIKSLKALADAGAVSFKIEGRLKGVDYVKNVVAAYSQELDRLIARRPDEYCRASLGHVAYSFEPNLSKTFNRGYTDYFLHGRQPDIFSPDTPKALGEMVGRVKEIRRDSFNVAGTAAFANGDGLCFIGDDRELHGFRVNRAEGNRLFPLAMPRELRPGIMLYRNNDVAFEKLMAGRTAERRIPIAMTLRPTADGFELEVTGHGIAPTRAAISCPHEPAQKPQRENILRQLSKLGNTPYELTQLDFEGAADSYFIPSSLLAELRRQATKEPSTISPISPICQIRPISPICQIRPISPISPISPSYQLNIANHRAKEFYQEQGMPSPGDAFEVRRPDGEVLIMQCRHCIRYSLGYCVRRGGKKPTWREPLSLRLGDGRTFRLDFQCKECQMNVVAE